MTFTDPDRPASSVCVSAHSPRGRGEMDGQNEGLDEAFAGPVVIPARLPGLRLYDAKAVESVPGASGPLLRPGQPTVHLSQRLAPRVIFGRDDLVRDAPVSRVDLLLCRNTLM